MGQTAMIISLFISLALYIGSMDTSPQNPIRQPSGDIYSTFYNNQTQGLNSNVLGGVQTNPSTGGINPTTNYGYGYTDGLLLIMSGSWSFVKMLFMVIIAPISMLTSYPDMPIALKMLIAVPLQLLNIMGIVALIRGVFSW
jgi:hypothetical protein